MVLTLQTEVTVLYVQVVLVKIGVFRQNKPISIDVETC